MRPDHSEFMDGLKLAAIALVSAALTATLVIGAGRTVLERAPHDTDAPPPRLLQTVAR